jgi:hypothetical protein
MGYWPGNDFHRRHGKLTIGLFDPANEQLVWRGAASKTLNISKNPDKNYRSLEKAMAKLFRNYPQERVSGNGKAGSTTTQGKSQHETRCSDGMVCLAVAAFAAIYLRATEMLTHVIVEGLSEILSLLNAQFREIHENLLDTGVHKFK